jgi:hypothetical protein
LTGNSHTAPRQKDLHHLIKKCQSHDHTKTCYKYCKPGEQKECRFNLDTSNVCPESSFDPETGEINLRVLDGLVNNFNETIIEAVRCNMDIKFIGSGASAKAILYYITDYITKSQLEAHVAYAALELAVKKLGVYNPEDDEPTIRAKKLLQKCAFAMISQQELSAQRVCLYILGNCDHYTSHEYKNLYWAAVERKLNTEDPSPECYLKTPSDEHPDNTIPPLTAVDAVDDEEEENENESDNESVTDENDENFNGTNVDDENEVKISANTSGEIIMQTSQLTDYIYQNTCLDDICLWDVILRLEKTRRPKHKKENYEDPDDDDDIASIDDEHETANDGENDDSMQVDVSSQDLLTDTRRIRPKFDFLPEHPEAITHVLKVRSILK